MSGGEQVNIEQKSTQNDSKDYSSEIENLFLQFLLFHYPLRYLGKKY